jgi:pimeloyl-ACP methyl ester carboxylesterase
VAPLLRKSGAEIYSPSLTGMGERSHLVSYLDPAELNLDLHIKDVVQLLEYEGLEQVVLVGHAYAGMVITGVAERCPERLAHLVYVNGVVPRDGEAMVDQLDAVRGPEFTARVRKAIHDQDSFLPPPASPEAIEQRWGISDSADQEWVLARLTPQPVAAFGQPLPVRRPEVRSIPRSFILSSGSGFEPVAALARKSGWGLFQIDTGHDPMVTRPRELADILLQIAGQDWRRTKDQRSMVDLSSFVFRCQCIIKRPALRRKALRQAQDRLAEPPPHCRIGALKLH